MSHIVIYRPHELSHEQARQAVETLISQLAERYEVDYHWQEDSLYFTRTGVGGQIDLEPGAIHINIQLGFLLAPIKSALEQEIQRQLDLVFHIPCTSA